MKKVKKIISVFILGFSLMLSAQEIKPIKITVERGIPGESFSKTTLGLEFWVQEVKQVITVDESETKVLALNDNTGKNLLDQHQKAVVAYKKEVEEQAKKGRYRFSSRSEQLIDFNSSRSLRDTIGFKFVLDSWVVPQKEATSIYCKAKVSYYMEDTSAKADSTTIKNTILHQLEVIKINNMQVRLRQNGYSTRNGEKRLYYELLTSDLGVVVEHIEQVDAAGKVLEKLNSAKANEKVSFTISEKSIKSPINLKFTFKPLVKKSIQIEQKVSLGL